MKSTNISSLSKDALIQRWQRYLHGRTHLNFQEVVYLLRQRQLLETLFCLFDRDSIGLLFESEWIGSIYKIAEVSNRTNDVRSLESYLENFQRLSAKDRDALSIDSFCKLFEDSSFRRQFVLLFLGETDILTLIEFIDILRAVSNVKSDTKWLTWLTYQFQTIVSKNRTEDVMDLETFTNSFYFKVPELAECLFNYLDTDKSGRLALEKLIERLEFIVDGSDCEKVEFLFKIFDQDADGIIDFNEMKLLLRCFLEQSPSLDLEETLVELAATLFKETDVDQSGDISLEELTSALKRNEHLFKVLSLSTSSWIQPKPAWISKTSKSSLTIRTWIRNNTGLVFFWSLYSFICLYICINVIRVYVGYQRAHFLLVIARINGGMLNFNCALVLLLMLRKHITWLRTKGGSVILPLDYHIDIHKVIGVVILIEVLVHTAAHLVYLVYVFNLCALPKDHGVSCNDNNSTKLNLLYNHSSIDLFASTTRYQFDKTMNQCVPFYYHGCGGNWNNFLTETMCNARCKPYRDTQQNYLDALFTSKLGLGYITGMVELILGAIFYIMCLPFVRKGGYFQLFYWFHMLTLPWLVLMLLHGPSFWKWLFVPGCLYLIEKFLRYHKSRSLKHGETFIMEAIILPSQVLHLVINRPRKFDYKPGDYLYINIPAVANFEWHPFSISSAPEHKDSIWLHVRACGHWTRRVYDLFREKLQQEYGLSVDGHSNAELRTSMRSRMSRSYISELRGKAEHNSIPDIDVNSDENAIAPSADATSLLTAKASSLSLPQVRFEKKLTSSCQSAITLPDRDKWNPLRKSFGTINSADDHKEQTTPRRSKPIIKDTNRLAVPAIGDYCLRIFNTPSTCEEGQSDITFNDSRISDVLGYLHMYQNKNRIQFNTLQSNDREDLQILIDGPYGAPSQHIFEAEHAVLIAAGIGITPFASILQSIMCRYRNHRHKCPNCDHIWDNPQNDRSFVKKVDFIWVTREQRSLEWFISLLARIEIEQQHLRHNSDKGHLLEVHLYVTSAKSAADLKGLNVYLSLDLIGKETSANVQAIDRIRQRTKHGRPDWDQVFTDLSLAKKGKISVFYCGPPALSTELTRKCRQYGFAFKKELF